MIADIGVAKRDIGDPELLFSGNYVVTYRLAVENTGTVALANLSLVENLASQFGTAFVGASGLTLTSPTTNPISSIAVDANFDGSLAVDLLDGVSNVLAAGDSFVVEFQVEVDPLQVTGTVDNQVTATGDAIDAAGNALLDSGGNAIVGFDLSDSGLDPGSTNPNSPHDTGGTSDTTNFEPAPLPLGGISGSVYRDLNMDGIRDTDDPGIEAVEVTLSGVDTYGAPVNQTVLTNANGDYAFTNLNAGIYRLVETHPLGYVDGPDTGDPAWTVGDDEFSNIVLNWGQFFTEIRFGEGSNGTVAGTPPEFPVIGPIYVASLGDLIDAYAMSSSTIYSGVPIGSNLNPLSLVSDRPVGGGYGIDPTLMVYGVPLQGNVFDYGQMVEVFVEVIEGRGVEGDAGSVVVGDGHQLIDAEQWGDLDVDVADETDGESDDASEAVEEPPAEDSGTPHAPVFLRDTFLRRMSDWLNQ